MLLADREREQRSIRDSVFMGLADFCRNAAGFASGNTFQKLPEWLEAEEYRDELRRYFKGGIPQLIEEAARLREGVAAVEQVIETLRGK